MVSTGNDSIVVQNQKKARLMFDVNNTHPLLEDEKSTAIKVKSKFIDEYANILDSSLYPPGFRAELLRSEEVNEKVEKQLSSKSHLVEATAKASSALVVSNSNQQQQPHSTNSSVPSFSEGALIPTKFELHNTPKPEWHAPWKLMRVISGHMGWVRCAAVDVGNQWFATGSSDRMIKIWDLASGTLKLTLTGHISTVRGLAVSGRHPYLFSCGEDKQVKCWDLEYNKVIRHYHGHLSAIFCINLHPKLDILVTGGRDSTARVWDMRTRQAVHILQGHTDVVADVACQAVDPQIITGSMDKTVRLWDLAAGKTMTQLTHHKKSVRALALHPTDFTFASGSSDNIKQWKLPKGDFLQNFSGQKAIINTLSVNHENVFFSGADNGTMRFWDWKSGYCFQDTNTIAQSGSLESECGIFCSTFDMSGTRLITGEADKSIKIWREDPMATEETHPIHWRPSLKRDHY